MNVMSANRLTILFGVALFTLVVLTVGQSDYDQICAEIKLPGGLARQVNCITKYSPRKALEIGDDCKIPVFGKNISYAEVIQEDCKDINVAIKYQKCQADIIKERNITFTPEERAGLIKTYCCQLKLPCAQPTNQEP